MKKETMLLSFPRYTGTAKLLTSKGHSQPSLRTQ